MVSMSLKDTKWILEAMRREQVEKSMYFKTAAFKFVPKQNADALAVAIDLLEKEIEREGCKESKEEKEPFTSSY